DAALAAAKAAPGVSRIVTLDGDVVTPGGAITGGSRSHRSEGLLGRSRQLEELGQQLANAQAGAEEAAKEIARLDEEWASHRQRIAALEEERRTLEMERLTSERDVRDTVDAIARLKREIEE